MTRLHLPQDLASVREARRFVGRQLEEWALDDLVDTAYLVVSELAANAVTHAHTDYEIRLSVAERTVRIAVRDSGPGFPQASPTDVALDHGRGLMLVAAMSADWGVDYLDAGKVVWAELRSEDAASA